MYFVFCSQQGHAGNKTLHQKILQFLTGGAGWLMQVDLHNGRKMGGWLDQWLVGWSMYFVLYQLLLFCIVYCTVTNLVLWLQHINKVYLLSITFTLVVVSFKQNYGYKLEH